MPAAKRTYEKQPKEKQDRCAKFQLVKTSAHDRIMAAVAETLPMQSDVKEMVVSRVVIAKMRSASRWMKGSRKQ